MGEKFPSVVPMPPMPTAMRKRRKRPLIPRLFLVGGLAIGAIAVVGPVRNWLVWQDGLSRWHNSPLLKLAHLPPSDRATALTDLVQQGGDTATVSRAKYVLASDLIQQDQGSKALRYLDNLERDYPLLAPYILWKRALAQELTGERAAMESNLQQLVTLHPTAPLAAEALERLGRKDPKYWQQALEKFPRHPKTLTVLGNMMENSPRNPELMLKYLRSGGTRFAKGVDIADKLSNEYMPSLRADDWRLIAEVYLQNHLLDKALAPLARSPQTAGNLLLLGKTARETQKIPLAKATYQGLVNQFADTPEADQALLALAELSANSGEALGYLDRLIPRNHPELTPAALNRKANLLYQTDRGAAEKLHTELIQRFPSSEAAAGLRWEQARARASQGQYPQAWELAKAIVTDSPNTRFSARAAYWIGKWAQKLGRSQDARQAFTFTMARYTQSYYSWRSAQQLGLDVGSFTSLRSGTPKLVNAMSAWTLPIGSGPLRELYQVGAYRDAWNLWQAEFPDRERYSVPEQFAEGMLLKGLERYQVALARVSQLETRTTPAEVAEHQKLQQSPSYWQALYPLAYFSPIQTQAGGQAINPLLVISVVRQESKFDPETRSPVGALGLMQVMPATAEFIAPKLNLSSYQLILPADNIKLGTWYLAHMHDTYKDDSLLAAAAYNAGPGNVDRWLKQISYQDPDDFLENIPFDETQNYVRNVLGNYWNYLRTYQPAIQQQVAQVLDRTSSP